MRSHHLCCVQTSSCSCVRGTMLLSRSPHLCPQYTQWSPRMNLGGNERWFVVGTLQRRGRSGSCPSGNLSCDHRTGVSPQVYSWGTPMTGPTWLSLLCFDCKIGISISTSVFFLSHDLINIFHMHALKYHTAHQTSALKIKQPRSESGPCSHRWLGGNHELRHTASIM